jgi:hypothetical protein
MLNLGKRLIALLLLSLSQGAAMAQSALPEDPLSELAQSLSSPPVQPRRNPEVWVKDSAVQNARRRPSERPHHSPKADRARTIRAKAEVTIVNEDQVIVRLTRRGIGHIDGTAVKH